VRAQNEQDMILSMTLEWKRYGRILYGGADRWNDAKVRAFKAAEPWESVLDLGIGEGGPWNREPGYLAGRRYVGVDGTPAVVDAARARGVDVHHHGFDAWAAGEGPDPADFDLVVAADVLFHIVRDDSHDAFVERLFRARRAIVVTWANDLQWRDTARGPADAWFNYFPRASDRTTFMEPRAGWRLAFHEAMGTVHTGDQQLATLVRC
jgi:SAM-dependent methyltransferase